MPPRHLKYGRTVLPIDPSIASSAEFLSIHPPRREKAAAELFSDILSAPLGADTLERYVAGAERPVLIVPDKTRLCGADLFLPVLLERIERAGIPRRMVTVVLATGTHPLQTREEIREIVGDEVLNSCRIVEHDARREDRTILVGTTVSGTPVRVLDIVAHADRIIAAGTIVHHYFAGYGGGMKMLVPGCAAYATAIANHRRTVTEEGAFHPNCRDGITDGNPVFEDIADMIRFFPPVYYFAVVLDGEGEPVDGVCGDLATAHREGMKKIDRYYAVPIATPVDLAVVSAGGYPKDINFIQAHKSIQHASYAVKEGGVILCFAQCADGLGNSSFLEWFRHDSPEEMRRALLERYSMNGHTALSLMDKTARHRIIFMSDLDPGDVRLMGMIPATSAAEAFRLAASLSPSSAAARVIPDGALCVPVAR